MGLAVQTIVVGAALAEGAPVLREARAEIRLASPTTCAVSLTLTVEGVADVTHRIDLRPGTRVDLLGVDGGAAVAPPTDIGRTRALTVRAAGPYTLRYDVALPDDRAYHCPIWLPVVPADGRSRAVALQVTLPEGATASGTMPVFRWAGAAGVATSGHLPAFVVVPYAGPGEPRPWDVSRVMDAVTLGTLAVATLLWMRRARARRPAAGESPA